MKTKRPVDARSARSVEGEFYGTPKELWGFSEPGGPGSLRQVSDRFLARNAERLGLHPQLKTLRHVKTVFSLGAYHVIYQQKLGKRRVHRAYVTVHIDSDRNLHQRNILGRAGQFARQAPAAGSQAR